MMADSPADGDEALQVRRYALTYAGSWILDDDFEDDPLGDARV